MNRQISKENCEKKSKKKNGKKLKTFANSYKLKAKKRNKIKKLKLPTVLFSQATALSVGTYCSYIVQLTAHKPDTHFFSDVDVDVAVVAKLPTYVCMYVRSK